MRRQQRKFPGTNILAKTEHVTPASTANRVRLFARLAELGITTTTVEHEPMFTVEQLQALRGNLPGAHTKNLFLTDKDGHVVLVVAKDDTRVDLKRLASRLKFGRFSFGNAELLAEVLRVAPGSVTPFALLNDIKTRVTVVMDAALTSFAEINCHPMENTATTRVATEDMLRFIRACGHEPLVLALS